MGTITDGINNITEYTAAGYTPGATVNTWRENFLTGNGMQDPPIRITTPPVGTPSVNHVLTGDMTVWSNWTAGANWTQNPQDDVASVGAPQTLFYVAKHTAGNTAELVQTQAQQPAAAKITPGVTYRVEFRYKWLNDDDAVQSTNGISIGLGTTVSDMYTTTDNKSWKNVTVYLTAAGANPSFRIIPTANFFGYVDDVWVKVAAMAGDPLDTGTVGFTGGVGPYTKMWEDAEDYPSSNSVNQLNNESFKGNANNWNTGTWTYVDKGSYLNLIPFERMEKTTSDTTTLEQPSANMKRPLIPGEWYVVSYFLYQTAGTLTPNLSGTNLTARSFVNSGDQGQVCTQLVQNGTGTQQLQFVPTSTFRGRIYWAYVCLYNSYTLDPYWLGDPPGSRTPDMVADGVTGDPNDNGYRGLGTYNLVFNYLIPNHDGMAPWLRISDTQNDPAYTSATIYNPPDRPGMVPPGSIGEEALGGRTTPMAKIEVGSRPFEIYPQPPGTFFAYTGQPFTLTSGARGGDSVPIYQWYKGNPGDTSNPVGVPYSKTYSRPSAAPSDNGTYYMRATNLAGSLDSNAVVVTVVDPVSITSHPSGGNKAVGGSHTFSATATGGAGSLTYALYMVGNGTPLQTNGTGTFTLDPLVAGDEGSYYITATDAPAGSSTATSNTVLLTVLATTNPAPRTATSGDDNVTFSVTASQGAGGYTYQWYLDGVIVNNDAGHISGATTSTLRLDNVQVLDGTYTGHPGVYTCVVRDSANAQVTSGGAALTVNAAAINLSGPSNQSVYYTQTAVFTVTPSGGSGAGFAYTYTWYLQGNPTPLVNGAKYDLTTPGTLRVLNVDGSDNGTVYYCNVGETPGVRPPANLVSSGNATLTSSLAPITAAISGNTRMYVGDSQTFTVSASGGVGTLTYQWQRWSGSGWNDVGTGGTIYTIDPLALSDATDYRCLVGDNARPPAPLQASNVLSLQVADRISVSSLPTPVNRKTGDSYTFSVTASGGFGPLSYQWKQNESNVGANASTLDLSPLSFAKQGSYTCTVTDTHTDTKTTNAAALTVLEIQTQPSGANVTPGSSHTFSIVVTPGSGVPGYAYQWQKWNESGSTWDNVGANSTSHTIDPVAPSDAGRYRCQVTDSAAVTLNSSEAVLVVTTNPIVIDTQPVGGSMYATESKTFTIAAHGGDGTLSYQWQKKDGENWNNVATGTVYTINSLVVADSGTYRCLVTDAFLQTATSDEVVLSVTVAAINISAPAGAQKLTGQAHTFSVTASGGVGTLTYQWQKDGVNLGNEAGHIEGVDTNTLILTNLVTGDEGTYVCLVGDDAHPSIEPLVPSSGALLEVRLPVSFSVQPAGANKKVADNHTFSVTAIDGYQPYTYQWYRGTTPVGGNESTLVLANLAAGDQGSYTCQVTGALGSATTSEAAVLTVLAIETQPTAQNTPARGSATFSVGVLAGSGVPDYTYQWKYKGADIPDATDATLTILNCQGGAPDGNPAPVNPNGNEGNYSCVITDSASVALESSAVPLTVNSSALDIIGPENKRAHLGGSATFTVSVSGGYGPDYTYQWQKDGLDLADQTAASLTISPVEAGSVGSYTCLVGEQGVRPPLPLVPSVSATLEVADPVSITSDPEDADLYVGDTFTATVAATGGYSPYAYQWRKNDAPMSNKTTATLVLSGVTAGDAATYSATVTDAEGSSATSAGAVLTVVPRVSITTHPVGGQMEPGVPYTLSVAATGGKGALQYTWFRNGNQISSGSPTYEISVPSFANIGNYWCVVSDSATPPDTATSDVAVLTINAVFGFQDQPQSARLYTGTPYTLTVSVMFETGDLTFTWYRPGGEIFEPGIYDTPTSRTWLSIQPFSSGDYYVVVVDDMGTPEDPEDDKTATSDTATLDVRDHLLITGQPVGGNAANGGSFTFTVTTNGGFAPLAYKWQKEGSPEILGTGATLVLNDLTPADSGSYYVTVSDDLSDVVESSHAQLLVAGGVPVGGWAGLGVLAGAFAAAALRVIRRKK
ncbi:MAG TPA: hypothetical protein P5318_05905 [Candidatus Hydrogenedentes bacterium]|nr:hypothetical protein [Candidatus Hydrogenedentota bacterium]HRT19644.1 hypothetical protein [Candidatus Hydrogenedentota bacterium]HRT64418.1 hypothetical protein [Candidatus Hydrogenedentota bacterium]